jgi:hypothetical protein
MLRGIARHLRNQPVAFVALFVALGGGAMAANGFIRASDVIPRGRPPRQRLLGELIRANRPRRRLPDLRRTSPRGR